MCVGREKCIPFPIMETNHHLYYKCHWGSFVCFVFSHMFCRQKTLLPFIIRKNFDCMCEKKICIPLSIMKTNHHLHWCHWWSFMCFVFSHMICPQKTLFSFVFRRNFIKSVLMKLSYLIIVCGKRKHAYLFPLWRPITICIGVIGDHLCVLCSHTCSVVKKPFCLSFLGKRHQISANET